MISEKTVELNVTAELLGWLYWVTRRTHVALGPSQREEGRLGYDVAFDGGAAPVALIQYKRAYISNGGAVWQWRLNRTTAKDQHRRLQTLERWGFPVLYAFPFFHTPAELHSRRRQLLVNTFWYPPSLIRPTGPMDEHHEVCHEPASGRWWVQSSEPVDIQPPLGVSAVLAAAERTRARELRLEAVVAVLNDEFGSEEPTNPGALIRLPQDGGSSLLGQSMILSYPDGQG